MASIGACVFETNSLNLVILWAENEGCIGIRVRLEARSGLAAVCSPGRQSGAVKILDHGMRNNRMRPIPGHLIRLASLWVSDSTEAGRG